MPTSAPPLARPGVRAAVPLLVAAGTIISLCMGLRQSLGLFLDPLNQLGVSASLFGFALALQNLVWGLAQPFVGALGDRYGARPVLLGGSAVYAAGLLLMVLLQPVPGLLLGLGVLVGLGVAATGFGVLLGAVSAAVPPERRSWAVGLVSGAGSLGTMLLAPVGQALLDGYGWQAAMLAFAAVAGVMSLVGATVRGGGGQAAAAAAAGAEQTARDALAEALAHRGYLAMTVAFFACGFQLVFIAGHLPKYLAICGVAPSVGATALGVIGLCNAVGSYLFGWLGQRYDKSKLLALIYLLRTLSIAVFVLLPVSPAGVLAFAAAMGFLWLGVAPLVSGLIGGMFGLRHFNMLYGVVFLGHQAGSFAGAWMGGIVLDLTGAYDLAWAALVLIGLAAAALQWPMDTRPVARMRAATA